jgi:hypothetical protein
MIKVIPLLILLLPLLPLLLLLLLHVHLCICRCCCCANLSCRTSSICSSGCCPSSALPAAATELVVRAAVHGRGSLLLLVVVAMLGVVLASGCIDADSRVDSGQWKQQLGCIFLS